ncbi:16S rRNA (cytosine(967)-C(5))-methyltransferase RsmB [Methylomonas sp. HYX-M1]|uniref:16S rRNA (cytosine(967)-C(5))-methyltransferase RsmB n=1 Tax=Methylomonas sp. HYX-M1 TaxID=3139307 RepID=UPI00345BF00A
MKQRNCAAVILARVIGDGQSLTAALDQHLGKIKDNQDRAFIQAVCYGVIRHYFELDYLLGRLLDKPLKAKDSDVKALLLAGLYQLRYMRVKPHAAVSETVAAAHHKPWAKSLVNAVLRRYLRDSETLLQAAATERQARQNHPAWLLDLLESDWPEQAGMILTANDRSPPLALRVNLSRNDRAQYLESLTEQGIGAKPIADCASGLVLDQAISVEQLPGFADGRVSVQDGAAQLAAELLELHSDQRVLDVCAAPGGKTAAILEREPRLRYLLAVDVDPQRLERVAQNLRRLGLQAELRAADAADPASWASDAAFDRILLDAPCSGLGVIRRHPDIKLLRRPSDIDQLVGLQRAILESVWPLLAPGGLLLYATCSISKRENERQIAEFLAGHPEARELPIKAHWGIARPHGRQILPGDRQMDGFYYAKLGKTV